MQDCGVMPARLLLILLLLILIRSPIQAQQSTLTLDQAIALALRDNHALKIARLEVDKADENISAAKTFRLPSLHAYTLVSGNLAGDTRPPHQEVGIHPRRECRIRL